MEAQKSVRHVEPDREIIRSLFESSTVRQTDAFTLSVKQQVEQSGFQVIGLVLGPTSAEILARGRSYHRGVGQSVLFRPLRARLLIGEFGDGTLGLIPERWARRHGITDESGYPEFTMEQVTEGLNRDGLTNMEIFESLIPASYGGQPADVRQSEIQKGGGQERSYRREKRKMLDEALRKHGGHPYASKLLLSDSFHLDRPDPQELEERRQAWQEFRRSKLPHTHFGPKNLPQEADEHSGNENGSQLPPAGDEYSQQDPCPDEPC